MKSILNALCLVFLITLTGCALFQVRQTPVTQGNIITNNEIRHLHTGLSQKAVIGILGTPLLVNLFTPNRLAYVYTYQAPYQPRTLRQVTCLFDHGRLVSVQQG